MAAAIDTDQPWTIRLTSFQGVFLILSYTALLYLAYLITSAVHAIYFHPLSHVPGPKLWIALPLMRWISCLRGCADTETRYYHSLYGPTIRVSPTELSFIASAAWDDIYGFKNNPEQHKWMVEDPNRPPNIMNGNAQDHARFRKALLHGFSNKSLRDQEPLLQGHIDTLISKFRNMAEADQVVNLEQWYNFATFDLIGDLALGQKFSCLHDGALDPWFGMLLKSLQLVPIIRGAAEFPIFMLLLKKVFMTNKMKQSRSELMQWGHDCIRRRIDNGNQRGRPDFVDSMMRNNGTSAAFTEKDMVSNALVILLAGSETTASLLTGLTYYLLKTPRALKLAADEVRQAFASEAAITIASISSKCPYLLACLEEGLRLYPPAPSAFPRVTVQPMTTIAGIQVPAGTRVGVHQTAAFWSPTNFARPREFVPERWLKEYQKGSSEFAADDRAVMQPFSYGPRNCIGRNLAYAEMKLILARMLWCFDLRLEGGHEGWEDQRSSMVWIKKPLLVRLSVREGV